MIHWLYIFCLCIFTVPAVILHIRLTKDDEWGLNTFVAVLIDIIFLLAMVVSMLVSNILIKKYGW